MNNWNIDTLQRALQFATAAHYRQTYGGWSNGMKIDYMVHINAVATNVHWLLAVSEREFDAELMLLCAVLHDTLEDTTTTAADLENMFGTKVSRGVLSLTKNTQLPKPEQMPDSLRRIQLEPKEISIVKMADRIANLQHPPYYWNTEKIMSYKAEAQQIYNALYAADPAMAALLQERINNYPPKNEYYIVAS